VLQLTDIFSPNEVEAESIVGPGTPQQLVQRLLAAGAPVVALRRGDQGVMVGQHGCDDIWQVRFELI